MIREHVFQGITVRLEVARQVITMDAPEKVTRGEPVLHPVPPLSSRMVPASLLSFKAKQFDDALYAAVEVAVQRGFGKIPSKLGWLSRFGEAALAAGTDEATLVFAACELGGAPLSLPPKMRAGVKEVLDGFLSDATRSKPLGFYSATEELASIFRQDRLLMTPLRDVSTSTLAALVKGDPELLGTYKMLLSVTDKMTNPKSLDKASLLDVGALEQSILVPSRSPEGELVKELFGARPVPEGFDLAEEIVRRVSNGTLSLLPKSDSGYYEHQLWALAPLAAPTTTHEASRLRFLPEYVRHLADLFKGLYALTRETHVKQLEVPLAGCAPMVRLHIDPALTVEPLPTHYARRALSYHYVAKALLELFGPSWREIPWAGIPSSFRSVGEGVEAMEALFWGAHVRACRDLGIEHDGNVFSDRSADADDARFRTWASQLSRDEDLTRDTRMMVPVFYDIEKKKTKVWALLGWTTKPITAEFRTRPEVLEVIAPPPPPKRSWNPFSRSDADSAATPPIEFSRAYHEVAHPVTAEMYVDRLLSREEVRRVCDTYREKSAMVKALVG